MMHGSERQTRANLQVASLAAAYDLAECAVGNGTIRRTEVSIVKCIEGFKAQFKAGSLTEMLFTIEAHVPVAIGGAAKIRLISVAVSGGVCGGNGIGRGVEPLIRVLSAAEMRIVQPVGYGSDARKVCVI